MRPRRNYRKKTPGRYNRRKTGRSFQARVKRVIMKTTELHYATSYNENLNLYHDVGYGAGPTTSQKAILFNPWVNITKGDTISQRTGDEIIARGMKVRLWLANKLDRPNVLYRVMVVVLPKYYGGALTTGDNVDLFQTNSGNNTMCALPKREGFKVLYDKIVPLEAHYSRGVGAETATTSFKEAHKFKQFYIKSKKGSKLKWMEDGTLANRPMAFYVIPYDSFGTLQTDNIGSCCFAYSLFFRDP